MSHPRSGAEPTALLVASGGGHLRQLHQLAPRLAGLPERRVWVTFDTPQSRSLLRDEDVRFARFTAPRDYRSVLINFGIARRTLRTPGIEVLVSTGSGLALPFFALAPLHGVRGHYIESAARIEGPSLTGRLIARLPGSRLYTQHARWSSATWRHEGAVFDDFRVEDRRPSGGPLRVVVTLGTIPYDFSRLVRRLVDVLPDDAEILWQTGRTPADHLRGTVRASLPHAELVQAMHDADVVVAHAGVGSALDALAAGRLPILVAREASHGEHIDDHQRQIAELLDGRGLAVSVGADGLGPDHLRRAATSLVTRRADRAVLSLH